LRPGFGDNVRIRSTPLTVQLGLADLSGSVYGESVPSSSGVQVTGPCPDDFALNVVIPGREGSIWLAPDLVEFVDHSPGTEIKVGSTRLIRAASGEWIKQ
jgi:hypothetical protein